MERGVYGDSVEEIISNLHRDIDTLTGITDELHEELSDREMEIRRLRWVMSVKLNFSGTHSMLHDYEEINPAWIDSQIYENSFYVSPPPYLKKKDI